jgi:sortase A
MESAAPVSRSLGRTLVRRLGVLVTALGVLLLVWGFVTWQWGDPVTGLWNRWEQRKLADSYEAFLDTYRPPAPPPTPSGRPAPVKSPQHVKRAARQLRAALETGQPVGRLRIEELGLDAVVVNGTDSSSLRKGPGRDERTAMPGEGALVYVAGHRTTFGAPFAHIDRLERGDRIVFEVPYATFVYRVTGHVIVPADDLARLESRGREEIALQACHPRFSASQRYIVYARPVERVAVEGP